MKSYVAVVDMQNRQKSTHADFGVSTTIIHINIIKQLRERAAAWSLSFEFRKGSKERSKSVWQEMQRREKCEE